MQAGGSSEGGPSPVGDTGCGHPDLCLARLSRGCGDGGLMSSEVRDEARGPWRTPRVLWEVRSQGWAGCV